MLRAVAQRLRGVTRRDDDGMRASRGDTQLLSRLDGDEFLLLLPNLTDPEVAARVARRILQSLVESFSIEGDRISVSPSVGIAVAPDDGHTPEDVLAIAAAAAALAYASGRNTYRFGSRQRNQAALERLKLEAELGQQPRAASSSSSTSPSTSCARGASSARRRSCAGSTRRWASSARTASSPSPRRRA
jgi:predicted signal transduction protein with EAL and GGDEF domain